MRRILASALVMGALALFSACASSAAKPETPADPPSEFVGPPQSQPADRAAEDFENFVKDVERAIAAKEYRTALQMLRAEMITEITAQQTRRLELIMERAKFFYFTEQMLDSFVTVRDPWVIVGAPIRGEIVVTNMSNSTVTIHVTAEAPEPGKEPVDPERSPDGRPSVLRIVGDFREYWPDTSIFVSTEYHNVGLDKDVVLAGGETVRIPFEINSAEVGAASKFLREFDVEAEFYCGRVDVDGDVFHGVLKSKRARVRVFPRNAEHLAKNPVGRLREAFEKNAPLHLTLAAGFVEKKDRRAAMDLLRELLAITVEGGVMERATICAMRILSDQDLGVDRTTWMNFAATWRPE